ncbi:hypothetical protein QQ045_002401 [Rhodiola kirilowii]
MRSCPWVVFGDFNEVLSEREVRGRRARRGWQIDAFREAVTNCGLLDLGFSGNQFTFSNRRQGVLETKARLVRVLANENWIDTDALRREEGELPRVDFFNIRLMQCIFE